MKRIAVLVTMTLIAGAFVLPAAPAEARFAGAARCEVTLPEWPTNGVRATNTSCVGDVYGVDLTNPLAPDSLVAEPFELTIESYNESCTLGTPPAIGRYDGTITKPAMGHFEAARVGATLVFAPVIEGSKVAGVGAFVPTVPLGDCPNHQPLTVTIAGLQHGEI